jgi:hypothetical protein
LIKRGHAVFSKRGTEGFYDILRMQIGDIAFW